MKRPGRRSDALSRPRIVDAAIDILDLRGETGLTFRALAAYIQTGAGAIYWHISDKRELLAATTSAVISTAMEMPETDGSSVRSIESIALGIFDAIDAHPWVGAQLAREPWQTAMLRVFEGIGNQLEALGVPEADQFNAASALLNYILGLAGQYAAGLRLLPNDADRTTVLTEQARQWSLRDPAEFPFVRRTASQLATHDDRKQFLAGINLIMTGILEATH